MKTHPPKWADRFLQWYCRVDLLEEIQGDVYELFYRSVKEGKRKADFLFVWNVLRFFRFKNIRKRNSVYQNLTTVGMLQNIFKVAVRNFFRQPTHSLLNVAGLSISFVAAILISLWVFHETSFDKFHKEAGNIFKVMSHVNANGTIETYSSARSNINLAAIPDVTEKAVVITGTRWPNELCFRPEGKTNECIWIMGLYSEQAFFSIFNFPIIEGDKNPLASPTNIAISESMAEKLYGDADPIGKIIKIDDNYPVTIASVFQDVPSNSTLQFDFVLPTTVFARMRGLSDDYFSKEFQTVYFKTNTAIAREDLTIKLNDPTILTEDLKKDKLSYSAFPFVDSRLRSEFVNGKNTGGRVQYVNLFMLVAVLVIVMAVINFVNLSTARGANRSKEIGIRKVTGAQRSSIALQFVGESFLIVLVAMAIAVLVAQLALPSFNLLIDEKLSVSMMNPAMLGWIAAFAIIVALAAGIYPAWIMSAFQPAKVLKGNTVTASSGAQHLRKVLLVVQVSVSIGIIIFTGVLFQQMNFIQEKNLGMDSKNIIHIEPTYNLLKQFNTFKNELLKHNEIENVAATSADPIDLNYTTTGVKWPGMPDGKNAAFKVLGGSDEMAKTFGLTVLEGRMFEPVNGSRNEITVFKNVDSLMQEVVVTESAVKEMELKEPVGTVIGIGSGSFVIVGVVKDFHTESLKQEQLPVILYSHDVLNCSRLYVKYLEGTTATAFKNIDDVYKKLEPAYTMKYGFVDDAFDKMYKTEKMASLMLILFTGIALVMAVIGVVGLATYNVIRRKKEIGVKRVLGASVLQVLSNLSREFVLLIAFAALLAIPAAWYTSDQWLQVFAYRINMPWWIFMAAFAGITLLTLCLIALQGLKTIRTNPTEILKSE